MNIQPISELKNYNTLLKQVKNNKPIYLTKNGKGAFAIYNMHDAAIIDELLGFNKSLDEIAPHNQSWYVKNEKDLENKLLKSAKDSELHNKTMGRDEFLSKMSKKYKK